jgi:DNA processing protein
VGVVAQDQLAMTLLDMELQGFIRSLPGKAYRIN